MVVGSQMNGQGGLQWTGRRSDRWCARPVAAASQSEPLSTLRASIFNRVVKIKHFSSEVVW
jgi:hypothetical protein